MKNKKMLKVLSTSFILGTILMTNPTGAEKVGGELSLSENLAGSTQNGQNGKESVDNNAIENKEVVTGNVKVNGKDAKKITTTIYEVDKKTGKLINPKSTVKTILNAEKIEDIAKKSYSG